MPRARFLPVFLTSFAVTVTLLTPGALRAGDGEVSRPMPAISARA